MPAGDCRDRHANHFDGAAAHSCIGLERERRSLRDRSGPPAQFAALLSAYRPGLLECYWHEERTAYVQRTSPDDLAAFEPWWNALGEFAGFRTQIRKD